MTENDKRTPEAFPGTIQKAASLSTHEVTEEELKAINK